MNKIKNKRKILIILNNNFTALCMLGYFIQNQKKYKDIGIELIIDKTYKKSFLKRYNVVFIKKILNLLSPKYINHTQVEIPPTYHFNFKNFIFFLKNFNYLRDKNKQFIKKNLEIINNYYTEIWTGNSEFINFFNNNIKIIKFEHGLTEICKYLKEKKNCTSLFISFKRKIENFISNFFFLKKNYFFEFKLISLFNNFLSLKNKNISNLKIKNYLKSIELVKDNINNKNISVKKNILINYPLANYSNKKLVINFNNEFSNFIFLKLKSLKISKNHTLIIKRKPSHKRKNLINLIDQLKKKKIQNKIILFDNLNKSDFIIDLFIKDLKPKVLFSNLNSSIMLFKFLLPKNKIIETDKFVINFLEKNFKNLTKGKFDEISRFKEYKKNLYFFKS